MGGSDLQSMVRVAWMLAAGIALAGIVGVLLPAERHVREVTAHAHELYELANRNDRMLRNAAGLTAASRRVSRDVAYLDGRHGPAGAVLGALGLLRAESRRYHLVLQSFTPAQPATNASAGSAQQTTIAVRGTYRNILDAIADLSEHDVLLQVRDIGLALTSDGPLRPEIDATIGASIYPSIEDAQREIAHVDGDNP